MRNVDIVSLKKIDTKTKGSLTFFESKKDVPFEIKRVYYITGAKNDTQRGGHAHKSLMQYLFCPYGRVKITLDDGEEKKEIILSSPEMGVLITPCI